MDGTAEGPDTCLAFPIAAHEEKVLPWQLAARGGRRRDRMLRGATVSPRRGSAISPRAAAACGGRGR